MSASGEPTSTVLLFTRWGNEWKVWCAQPARDRPYVPSTRCEDGETTAEAVLRAAEEHGHRARLLPRPSPTGNRRTAADELWELTAPLAPGSSPADPDHREHVFASVVDRPFAQTGHPGRWLSSNELDASGLPERIRALARAVFGGVEDAVRLPSPPRRHANLRRALLDRQDRDQAVRLTPEGDRTQGFYDRWGAVDQDNTGWLQDVIAEHGWPGRALVAEDGATAAWLLAQHADRMPEFQADCLDLLARAVTAGDADVRHAALLEDRVRIHQGLPQVFGTQLAGQDDGKLKPFPMIDPPGVGERRAAWGFEPLDDYIRSVSAHQ
ncbi:DUF6624 domain-containing protein [Streptomyces sp. NPDC001889]